MDGGNFSISEIGKIAISQKNKRTHDTGWVNRCMAGVATEDVRASSSSGRAQVQGELELGRFYCVGSVASVIN